MQPAIQWRTGRYGLSVVATAVAFLVKACLGPVILPNVFLTCYTAVLVSSWYGGFGPGLLAAILGALTGAYFFAPPWLQVGSFVVAATFVGWLASSLGSTSRRLEQAERWYRSLVEGVKDYAILMLDAGGRVVSWNAGAQRIYDYAADEIVGGDFSRLLPDEQRGGHLDVLAWAAHHGRWEYESERVRKDGSRFWAHVVITPLYDHRRALIGFSKITHDVTAARRAQEALQRAHEELEARVAQRTSELSHANAVLTEQIAERKRAEEALRESQNRFASFMRHLPGVAFMKDLQGRYVFVNGTWEALFRRSPEQWLNKSDDEMFPPETAAEFKQSDRFVIESGEPLQRTVVAPVGGSPRYWLVSKFPIADANGQMVLLGGVVVDVTQKTQMEEALRHERNFASSVLDTVGALVGVADREGRVVRVNRAWERTFGYTSAEAVGRYIWELMSIPTEVEPARRVFQKLMAGEWPREYDTYWFTKDGSRRELAWSTSFVYDDEGTVQYVIGAGIDITEQKLAQEELRRTQERYALAVAGANDGLWDWDLSSDTVYLSPRLRSILGFGAEEPDIHAAQWAQLVHPDDVKPMAAEIRAHLEGRTAQFQSEHRVRRKDGTYRWVLSRGMSVRDGSGKAYRMAGSLTDIAQRKDAEQKLRESEERYRDLVENINDVMFVVDMAGNLTFVNSVIEHITGYHPAEVVGRPFTEFIFPEDLPTLLDSFERTKAGRLEPLEYRVIAKDGTLRWVRSSSRPIVQDGRQLGVRGVLADISDNKDAERALRESELRFRGTFEQAAVGIAHVATDGRWLRVNQKLCDIVGYAREELLERTFQDITHPDDLDTDLEYVARMLAGGIQTYSMEKRYVHKQGQLVWVNLTVALVREPSGEPKYFISVVEDITARKQAEEVLKTQAHVLDSLMEGVNVAEQDGTICFTNPAFDRMLGYEKGELIGAHVSMLNAYPPEENARIVGDIMQHLEKHGTWRGEFTNRRKDGTVFASSAALSVLEISGRRYWVSVQEDITERKRAEAVLGESERRFRGTFEQAAVGICLVATDGRWLRVNQKLCDIVGYTREELLERTFQDITHPDDLGADMDHLRRLMANEISTFAAEKRYFRKDGRLVWVNLTVATVREPSGEPAYFIGVIEDITARKHAEEVLKTQAHVLDAIIEGVSIIEEDGTICFATPGFDAMLGYERGELIGRHVSIANAGSPEEGARRVDEVLETLKTHGAYRGEFRNRRKDGTVFTSYARISGLDMSGRQYWVSVQEDITERKQAEERLRENEAKFRSLANTVTAAIFIMQGARMRYVNPAAQRITGYTEAELLEMDFWQVIHPDFKDLVRERGLARQRGEPIPSSYEVRICTKNGETRWVDFTGSLIEFEGDPAALGTAFDITERKCAEESDRQHQAELAHMLRVRTLGEMASSLAHELNQPLQAIINYASGGVRRLRSDGAPPTPLLGAMEQIRAEALRAGKIINRLRDLVRKGEPKREWADLNDLVLDASGLMAPDARRWGIDIQLQLAPELPLLQIDTVQVEQVILNLLRNGIEAMSTCINGDRTLSISTMRVGADGGGTGGPRRWRGAFTGDFRSRLRAVLHDQSQGPGNGSLHQPLDHRSARWAALGDPQRGARDDVPVHHLVARNRGVR